MEDIGDVEEKIIWRFKNTEKGRQHCWKNLDIEFRTRSEAFAVTKRVEIEVQKETSAMRIVIEEKLSEAKKEMEVMDKKLSEAKGDMKVTKKKLSEANMDMKAKIDERVKTGILTYLDSLGISLGANKKLISNEQVSDNSLEDR